jgi:hypothetical protein
MRERIGKRREERTEPEKSSDKLEKPTGLLFFIQNLIFK